MPRIVLMMSVSLDGFFESSDHRLDWQVIDHELHSHFNKWLDTTTAFLDGRVTYELMAGYWPTADQAPDASPTEVGFARIWRDKPKIVYSRTLDHADWHTTIARDVDIDQLNALEGEVVIGGANLAATFARHGLIDEYRIYVHPIVLGHGRPLFGPDTANTLRLVENRTFGSGVVLLRYVTESRGNHV